MKIIKNVVNSLFYNELKSDRIFGLDLLRAFSITTVLILHGRFLLPDWSLKYQQLFVFDGVTFFFVLSGFLIGGILIKDFEKYEVNFSLLTNFWIRRWTRTIPNYLLILTLLIVIYKISDYSIKLSEFAPYFFFLQNFAYRLKYFEESWSLSVEEWFYLLIPLMIFILTIAKVKISQSVLIVAGLIITIVTFLRYKQVYLEKGNISSYGLIVIYRLDSIMYGVIGAYIKFYRKKIWQSYKKPFLILGLSILLLQKFLPYFITFDNSFFEIVFGYPLTSFGVLCMLPFLSEYNVTKKSIFAKVITIISLISYSMYLVHNSLIKNELIKKIPWTNYTHNYNIIMPVNYFLYWAATILLSIVIYNYYEKPTTKFRDKIKIIKKEPN